MVEGYNEAIGENELVGGGGGWSRWKTASHCVAIINAVAIASNNDFVKTASIDWGVAVRGGRRFISRQPPWASAWLLDRLLAKALKQLFQRKREP